MKRIDQLKLFSPTHYKFKADAALTLIVLYYIIFMAFILFSGNKDLQDYLMEGTNIFSSFIGIIILVNAKVVDLFSFLESLKKQLKYNLWIQYKQNKLYKFIRRLFPVLIVFNSICLITYVSLIFITDDLIDKLLYFCVTLISVSVPGAVIYNSYLKIK